jgi:hypothetical protein
MGATSATAGGAAWWPIAVAAWRRPVRSGLPGRTGAGDAGGSLVGSVPIRGRDAVGAKRACVTAERPSKRARDECDRE